MYPGSFRGEGVIDARKLAELLRAELLSPVYHGETASEPLAAITLIVALTTEASLLPSFPVAAN